MAQAQSGILLEDRDFAIFMEINFTGDLDPIRQGCADFVGRVNALQTQFNDIGLGAVISFGHDAWRRLKGDTGAAQLVPFKALGHGMAKSTQRDMAIHIQSNSHKVNFALAKEVMKVFGASIKVEEEVHGFRCLEARDLSGFVDGTENPKGEERHGVAIIAQGEDAGGSYVLAQRWIHHLKQFNHFSVKQQENVFGRTKQDNIEMSDDEKPASAHIARVVIEEEGEELEIVRQGLPYGTVSGEHGLYFLAYCADLTVIDKMLTNMFGEGEDGEFDAMLSFTHAVTGSYLFAPSVETLISL